MKIKELQEKQQQLDNYIYKMNDIKVKDIFYDKIIALDVELSEFMNEAKTFKYWSKKKIMNEQKVLEEACDCYHFILSLANDLGVDLTVATIVSLPDNVNGVYRLIKNDLWKDLYLDREAKAISRIHFMLIDMICQLGYEYSDLIREYNRKYEINIQRQKEGY